MYRIYVKRHYYSGTLNAVPSGRLCEEWTKFPLEFGTREEAREIIEGIRAHRPYYLSHGEHAAPDYEIRKVSE